jgi:hypothetical protein
VKFIRPRSPRSRQKRPLYAALASAIRDHAHHRRRDRAAAFPSRAAAGAPEALKLSKHFK